MPYITSRLVKGIRYYYIYENYRENGKVKHRLIKYLGNIDKILDMANNDLVNIKKISCISVKNYGDILLFFNIIKEINLIDIINSCVRKNPDIKPSVGDLASIMIINRLSVPCSKLGIQEWYKRSILPDLLNIQEDQVYAQSLCRALDYLDDNAINNIQNKLINKLKETYNIDLNALFYDITSTYFEGTKCPIAYFGYSRDHRPDRKQIVIGLVISKETKFPLKHWVFPGNTMDWSTIELVVNELKNNKEIENFTIITDRGMFQKNLRIKMAENNLIFITGVKSSEKIAKDLIFNIKIEDMRPIKLKSGEQLLYYSKKIEDQGFNFNAILILSPKMRKIQEDNFNESITKIQEKLAMLKEGLKVRNKNKEKLKKSIDNIIKSYKKLFKIDIKESNNGNNTFTFELDQKEIEKINNKFGKYVIISNVPFLKSKEIIQTYIDKWKVESAFKYIKSQIKLRP
ncbi:MAG: IS1634 family transposase, partial [Candidatus Helarchaeota archaeon]